MLCENFALYHNKRLPRADPCCRSVLKEFAHAFSCACIELWMHLLEDARLEATIGCFLSPRPKLIGRQSHLKLSREVAEEITIFNILMEERSFYVVETKIRVTQ